jgi:hypothetical protein
MDDVKPGADGGLPGWAFMGEVRLQSQPMEAAKLARCSG